MLKYVEGDILLSNAQVIAHGVAPGDDFKNGLALSLREQWPAMYKDIRHYCHEVSPRAGQLWVWSGANGVRIVNLFTQEPPAHAGGHPGPAHIEFVSRSLRALREWALREKIQSLALPRIATGVGGLEWSDVEPLIKANLGDLKIPVYVYTTYRKGVKAAEQYIRFRAGEGGLTPPTRPT